ncbi:endo-1,4-beta-xylanase [Bacteroides sp. OttesenSCG-928-J23]|nr:endo-1,4-beta-xylanase [Bacteroides sp. OttesenSCG-928-J23]
MRQYINNIMVSMLALVLTVGCVDTDIAEFVVEKPQTIERMEYLNDYNALKTYIDRNASPNFKLGAGVGVSDFLKQSLVYNVMASNFDEVTAGNAMKYSSVVGDNGSMDFGQIQQFVSTAQKAGLTIYGHTLAWHSQQNNKYLNGLIKDKEIEVDPNDANNFIKYICGEAGANSWDKQAIYTLPTNLEKDAAYTLKVDIKASIACQCGLWPIWEASPNKNQWGGSNDVQYLEEKAIGTEWITYEWKFTAQFSHDKLQFVFGKHGGTISFDNFVLVKDGTDTNLISNGDFAEVSTTGWGNNWQGPSFEIASESAGPASWWTDLLTNGDAEGDDLSCFFSTEQGLGGPKAATIGTAGTGADGTGRAFVVKSGDNPEFTHSTQFFIKVPRMLEEGAAYRLTMKYRADKDANSESQAHNNPGGYIHWQMLSPNPSFTTEWQEKTWTGIISSSQAGSAGMNTIAFNLAVLGEANTYYFDDISFEIEESGSGIPLTPEEKKEVLTAAMERWVKGMMEACDSYVAVWDVVNEAISGGDVNGDGIYELQSVIQGTVSESDAKNNFYWQDYLGDIDYVRTAIKFARQYYEEFGGNPSDLKLFINDYNLESDWDDNKKLKSLINWIARWEEDGTKVDGIGTQMHVSYHENPFTQESKERHIVKMYELMAATGKLVKVSELDMGYVDEYGDSVLTEDMTEEQHKAMAEFYKFIIQKYFEIIPVNQQYGITQWAATDSPGGSGWRGGEPIGLWDLNYSRKHTYAGFADGLAGK